MPSTDIRTFTLESLRAAAAHGDPAARSAVAQVLASGGTESDLLRAVERAACTAGPAADLLAAAAAPLGAADAEAVAFAEERMLRNTWITGVVDGVGTGLASLAVRGLAGDGPVHTRRGERPSSASEHLAEVHPGTPAWRRALRSRLIRATTPTPAETISLAWRIVCHSHGMRAGLERLGVPMSPRRAAAHQRAWAALARLHGLPDALIARSPAEEAMLASRLLTEASDPPSPEEVDGWLDGLARRPPCFASRAGLLALGRHMVGSQIATALSLPSTGRWQVAWTLAVRSAAAATPAPAPSIERLQA